MVVTECLCRSNFCPFNGFSGGERKTIENSLEGCTHFVLLSSSSRPLLSCLLLEFGVQQFHCYPLCLSMFVYI